jgi:hypothetical protein
MTIALFFRSRVSSRIINIGLAVFWAWTGIAYHIVHFSAINTAAYVFGALFALQSALFLWGVTRNSQLEFAINRSWRSAAALTLIAYTLLVYPLLNIAFGHAYPHMPVFGVTPCPTVIFTFGVLMLATSKIPWYLIVIPLL